MRPLLALLSATVALGAPAPVATDVDASRAVASYVAMQRTFFDVRWGMYRETDATTRQSTLWPVSQALAATIAVARAAGPRTEFSRGARRRLARLLPRYASRLGYRAVAGGAGDVYYDDNVWVGLDLLDWYALTRDSRALAEARRVFGIVLSAWDGGTANPCPGGVFWTNAAANDDRNTVSTAGAALLSLRLYGELRRPELLYWGRRMTEWVDRCMGGASGLYSDHIGRDGTIDETRWSYNQGLMIAADDLLYRLGGDDRALVRAQRLARLALDELDREKEPPEFAAVLFRSVLELDRDAPDARYLTEAQAYADAAWSERRDPIRGVFRFRGAQARLLEQAALTQVYALLATAGR